MYLDLIKLAASTVPDGERLTAPHFPSTPTQGRPFDHLCPTPHAPHLEHQGNEERKVMDFGQEEGKQPCLQRT